MQRERKWLENTRSRRKKSIASPMLPLRGIDSKDQKAKSLDLNLVDFLAKRTVGYVLRTYVALCGSHYNRINLSLDNLCCHSFFLMWQNKLSHIIWIRSCIFHIKLKRICT